MARHQKGRWISEVTKQYLYCINSVHKLQYISVDALNIILSIPHIRLQVNNIYDTLNNLDNYDFRHMSHQIVDMVIDLQKYVEGLLQKHMK